MNLLLVSALGAVLLVPAVAADKAKIEDLPAAVQASVKEQTRNATLVSISKEVEKGKTVYEVETSVNGKTRDLMLDAAGKVTSIEEEADLAGIPDAARQAIQKRAAGGTVKKVEIVTVGSIVTYEAAIQKGGKSFEMTVNADGSAHK